MNFFFRYLLKHNNGHMTTVTLTLRQILFFLIDAVTSSNLALIVGLTSEKKNVSKSTGQFAALKTS